MRIMPFEYIPDANDRADAEHGNCIYLLDDENKYRIPLYFDCDERVGCVGKVRGGLPAELQLQALKFVTALGYIPVMEGLDDV